MIFSLEVLRARKGDCLLLHYGSADDPHLMVIDGGPAKVYEPHLRPRLTALHDARGLDANQPLPVDVLMVSHVDDDHINGVLDLTKELIDAKKTNKPQLVQILSLWHNSFENKIGSKPDELVSALSNSSVTASTDGSLPTDLDLQADDPEMDDKDVYAAYQVLASIQQGAQLTKDAAGLGIDINLEFDPDGDSDLPLILANDEPIDMGSDLKITVVGPMQAEAEALHQKHQECLKKLKKEGKTPEEVLSAFVDKSVANLSSLVMLAEVDGKTILLTGDARGDKVLEGLREVGLLQDGETLHVDVLKGPHHGSAHNVAPKFFKTITADHYVFSGNGEHGNPERKTFEMLHAARGDADYTIHLTYPINELDLERKQDWEKSQKRKKPKNRVPWDPAKHGLVALLENRPDLGDKVVVVAENKPHLIELQDAFGQ